MKIIRCSLFKVLLAGFVIFINTQACDARIANPYPVAILRHGDIYMIEGKDEINRLTDLGDIKEICWLDEQTVCFSRVRTTGLVDERSWLGFESTENFGLPEV